MTTDTSSSDAGRRSRTDDQTRQPPSAAITEILGRIDLETIVTTQVRRAARGVPAIAALPRDVLRGPFTDAVRQANEHALRALAEQRPHSEEELQDCAAQFTEVMAVWGILIEDIVATFALGAQVLWEATVRYATPEQLRAFLWAGGGALDSASLVERIAIESAPHVDRPQITAERAARTALATAADDMRRAPHPGSERTFVAQRPDGDLRWHAALAAELRAAGVTAATSNGHVSGTLRAGTATPHVDGSVLVTEALPRPGSGEDRRQRLHQILVLATGQDRRQLTDLDFAAERLLAASPALSRLLRARLAAVDATDFGEELTATAAAYVAADGDIAATARALGLHRESVRHRLRRIEELTDLDLSHWHGRCVLGLALSTPSEQATPSPVPVPPAAAAYAPFTADESSVVNLILDRVDGTEIARALVERRRLEQPGLAATLAASDAEDVSAAADVHEILTLLRKERPSRDQDLVGPSRCTHEYLRLGVAADDIVAIGRTTPQAVWHAVLDASTDEELRYLPSAIGRLILYIEATQLAITHSVARDQASAGAGLVEVLLDPEATGQALVALATGAGLTVDAAQRGVVIAPGPTSTAAAGRVAMDLRAAGWAAAPRGERVYGIGPIDAAEARLDEHLPPTAIVALGEPTPLRELGAELQQLDRLVDLAIAEGRTGRLDLSESMLELLLIARPDIAHAFREAIVAPLARRDAARNGTLVRTLHAYVAHDFQRGPTADALHLHRNSLDYRLRQITQEIGRTFRTIDDVFAILLGVAADRLLRVP